MTDDVNVDKDVHDISNKPFWLPSSPAQYVGVIGHRGMGTSYNNLKNPYVENTLQSFLTAHKSGARWVEMDVLPSLDGHLMLFHNHWILTPDGLKGVWQLTADELKTLGVETLENICDEMPAGLGLYLELKGTPNDIEDFWNNRSSAHLLADWVKKHQSHRPIITASFDPFLAIELNKLGVTGGWIGNESNGFSTLLTTAALARLPLVIVHDNALSNPFSPKIDLGWEIAEKHNINVWVWLPELTKIVSYRKMGVTGFVVNEVAEAVNILR